MRPQLEATAVASFVLEIPHPRHRVRVRGWRSDDVHDLALGANHPEVARFLRDHFPHPYTLEDAIDFIERVVPSAPDAFRAIEVDGRVVGGIGIRQGIDVYRRSGELGYWLTPERWRVGIMTAVVNGYVGDTMDRLDLVRVSASVYAPNLASKRLLERCGFAFEGTQRRAIVKAGVVMDALVYARIREDAA
jgi:ribosomal-protein-alanine N-acetyltransferase